MPRVVSFIVLIAIILLIGSMFFKVMVHFIVPLFLAAVLVVVFKPVHEWVLKKIPKRPKLGAMFTTLGILLLVILPLTGISVKAISEGAKFYNGLVDEEVGPGQQVEEDEEQNGLQNVISGVVQSVNTISEKVGLPSDHKPEDVYEYAIEGIEKFAAPLAWGGVQVLASTLFGLVIMVLAIYYFFIDGPGMVETLMKLSPLDDNYERELLDKFSDISRAVVLATLLSAIVQGILAGLGYYFAGVEKVFFLTMLTMFLSMVPFVGAAAVWVPTCAMLYFHDERAWAAGLLALYCVAIVSTVDNVIKPIVLHGQTNLHPLLALLSVVGGVQALGPIGILVGPMLVAFLQALLNMLRKELEGFGVVE